LPGSNGSGQSRDTYRLSLWISSLGLLGAVAMATVGAFAPGLDGRQRAYVLLSMAFAAAVGLAVNLHARKKLR
jgi:hypothetical protein